MEFENRTSEQTHMTYDEALEFLDRVASGLARTMGPFCETLVQDSTEDGLVVRSIYNGHISGRTVGSTLSIYGRDTAWEDPENAGLDMESDNVCLFATTARGRRVKSSTWVLQGSDYILELGVNMDITAVDQVTALLGGLTQADGELRERLRGQPRPQQEAQAMLEAHLAAMGKPAETLSRSERVLLVHGLREEGFFDFPKSVALVAARLGVSKCTIYIYLRE